MILKHINKNLFHKYFNNCNNSKNYYKLVLIRYFCNNNNNEDKLIKYEDYESLAVNDRLKLQIKLILNEYQHYKLTNEIPLPSNLNLNQMEELLRCYHVKKFGVKWVDLTKNKRKHLLQIFNQIENDYKNGKEKVSLTLTYEHLERLSANRLKTASLFGQNLVIDLSYDSFMDKLECKNCAEQIWRIYQFNRNVSKCPYNLHICNVDYNDMTFYYIKNTFPHYGHSDFIINITSKSYVNLFPKDKLIFLSPHADDEMSIDEYDHDAVFIIGGFVDRRKIINVTYDKAKQQSIKSVRLPLDKFMKNHNVQSLDDVFEVLNDLQTQSFEKNKLNWKKAIKTRLPFYKLKSSAQVIQEHLQNDYKSDGINDENVVEKDKNIKVCSTDDQESVVKLSLNN